MKRIRCSSSLCDQFLPSSRQIVPRPRITVTAKRPLLTSHIRVLSTPARAQYQYEKPVNPYEPAPGEPLPPARNPLNSAKLAALHARLSLHPSYPIQTLARALIDQSADPIRFYNNSSLAYLGNSLLGYYGAEFFMCTYPRLPTLVLKSAMAAFVGPKPLAAIGREWGVETAFEPTPDVDAGLLQFKRLPPGTVVKGHLRPARSEGVPEEDAMANFVRATFAGVYLHEGVAPSRQFFRQHVMSRKLDVDQLFNFVQPTRELSRLCSREGFTPPVARVISETGRKSRSPVFIVGVYSGQECLGQGHGASLDEARIRAAVNALKGWYLYSPANPVDLPSKMDVDPAASFAPAMIDVGEVIV
ncbi:ribonuclease III domain-containing protein [Morchella snyderi]|nr:ribonuclease III domain-containing protein [Morchella snyderi]